MKHLWAPWRMTYLECKDKQAKDCCVFCVRDIVGEDAERLILWRGRHAFVVMNKFPYTNGHLLIAPYRHIPDILDLEPEESAEMLLLLRRCRMVMQQCLKPQGFNIGMNLGKIAGAGVADHLHMHIVPRWTGDTNFMPVFAEVRVIPQHLEETYAILLEGFKSVPDEVGCRCPD
ncbi:HIT domain-containing protein [Syntrophotalea acetylenica]|uniref:HIT family protein n=1 Tax=Syntrophotalea acetylenica TaxID=29542 RepID=UPI002A367225|nr:HIT domain-containing protein [Syntrophotalea acetylenica]MDY0263301.1 HIT domain-containing protein [Syntrophotalea acetylenica]